VELPEIEGGERPSGASTSAAQKCQPWTFNDRGDNTGGVPSGARYCTKATITHQGEGNFIVWALNADNEPTALLVNEIGNYSGTVRWSRNYYGIEVKADGAWSIAIE